MPGTQPIGFELVKDNKDLLWVVERAEFGYVVHEVTLTRIRSFDRKWQAIKAIAEGEVYDR